MTGTAVVPEMLKEQTLAQLLEDGLFVDGDWVETKDQDPNGQVRLIQLADIGDGVFRNRSSRFLTIEKANKLGCTFLQAGDVLVARMPEPLGRACIFPGVAQPAVTAVDVCILRPNPDRARPEWLVKAINSQGFRSSMQQYIRGTTRQRISRRNLGGLRLGVPPLDAQMKLAAEVDEIESTGQRASGHVATGRRAIERFREAVLGAACSGRLTAEWRLRNPRFARGETAFENQREDVKRLIESPVEWVWRRLSDITEIRGGVQVGAKSKSDEPYREVPYLRVANVQRGWLDLSEIKAILASERKIAELRLEPGDMLFNEGGDRDKLGRGWVWEGQIEECIHQNHVFRARLRDKRMQPRFFSWYGNTVGASYFNDQGKQTVNLASLSVTKLGELPVPVPTVEEQAEIVRRIESLLSTADELLARIEVAERLINRSSQSVLAKAFRGGLVLSDSVAAIQAIDAT